MEFIDLPAQQARIRKRIDERIANVLDSGDYIMGAEVTELEGRLAQFCGSAHCVSCGNGTDALTLSLMALGVGLGDAVIVPSFTFAATAEAPCLVGATPIFADVDRNSFNIDPASVIRCISAARACGLKVKAIIAVDLFGLPADWPALKEIAAANGLMTIDDSAQGWGGEINGKRTGSFADITTTSFFPAKPLGCYGDGGAIFTDDTETAALLRSLSVHGKGKEKYDNIRVGTNSRLDTIQAAILLEKLEIYGSELEARQIVARRYSEALSGHFDTPHVPDGFRSIWAQYTLKAESEHYRTKAMAHLTNAGIPSAIYYPRPLHTQPAYSTLPTDPEDLPISEDLASRVFSLPMHPYLEPEVQDRIVEALQSQTT